jgi:hypothetical protein
MDCSAFGGTLRETLVADMASIHRLVIAVEGDSDRVVLEIVSRSLGRNLAADGVGIRPIGGAHAIRRFVAGLDPDVSVRGLCDEQEQRFFRRVLDDVHVCVPDLEGELIRALGVERMLEIVDRDSFATLQRQPAQRGRPIELQLHRWLRSSSSRYHRYLPLLAEAIEPERVPTPLRDALR